jgi:hypothetical protein
MVREYRARARRSGGRNCGLWSSGHRRSDRDADPGRWRAVAADGAVAFPETGGFLSDPNAPSKSDSGPAACSRFGNPNSLFPAGCCHEPDPGPAAEGCSAASTAQRDLAHSTPERDSHANPDRDGHSTAQRDLLAHSTPERNSRARPDRDGHSTAHCDLLAHSTPERNRRPDADRANADARRAEAGVDSRGRDSPLHSNFPCCGCGRHRVGFTSARIVGLPRRNRRSADRRGFAVFSGRLRAGGLLRRSERQGYATDLAARFGRSNRIRHRRSARKVAPGRNSRRRPDVRNVRDHHPHDLLDRGEEARDDASRSQNSLPGSRDSLKASLTVTGHYGVSRK